MSIDSTSKPRSSRRRFWSPFAAAPNARRPRRSTWGVEPLEGRALLSSVVFADGFGASGSSTPTTTEAVVTDVGGASYITGGFSGTVSFGNISLTSKGASNIYVAKLNPTGTVAWVNRMGGANQSFGDLGRGIAVDGQGNTYVTGFYSGQGDFGPATLTSQGSRGVFVVKLDIAGNFQWEKSFSGPGGDLGQAVAVDGSGNVFVAGGFQNSIAFGGTTLNSAGASDGFIAKLDSSGNPLWARTIGGAGQDSVFGLAVGGSGNVYTTGTFGQTALFAGGPALTSRGSSDVFVMKLATNGNVLWVQQFGGTGPDDGTALTLDGSGNLYATGDFAASTTFGATTLTSNGAGDVFLTRINPSTGIPVWAKGYGGPSQDAGFGLATDGAGNVYTTGSFLNALTFGAATITSQGGAGVFLLKSDANGAELSASSFGGVGNEQANGVAVGGPAGNVTVVGDYVAPTSVGGFALPASGTAFAVQFSQSTRRSVPPGDFLNLGYTIPSTYQPATDSWVVAGLSGTQNLGSFGSPNYATIPISGDFEGVGYSERAVFDPRTAAFSVKNPTTGVVASLGVFGAPNLYDLPVPGDYDGTGRAQVAVFRPATAQWFVKRSNGGQLLTAFGAPNLYDLPVPGDYDGTGRAEIAVFRPSTAQWFVLRANGGQLLTTFGAPNLFDIPIPGDWDHVGHVEPAVFRPSTGQIFVFGPGGSHLLTTFGATNYAEVPLMTSIAALLRLGKIGVGGATPHSSSIRSASGFTSSTASAAFHVFSPASSLMPVAPTRVNSSVGLVPRPPNVVRRAPLTTLDAVSQALDQLFGADSN